MDHRRIHSQGQGQGIQSHGETERNRQTEAAPATSGPACQVLQSHSLAPAQELPHYEAFYTCCTVWPPWCESRKERKVNACMSLFSKVTSQEVKISFYKISYMK
ncbi:uncharacterized protein LOC144222953 [Crocuta crocuta]